ncbi:MAG: thiamine-monophosphate kinase [Fibrobacteres bacterium]|nr:thiamine-monophosphate kinase [Fibrobacterota bacterium]
MNRHFAAGREFSLIERLFDASHFARNGEGLGDDGYLMKVGGETWAVSTDTSIEGIHYRLDWTSAEAALEKALLSNLSDINAMGGKTSLAFLNLGALKSWDDERIASLGKVLALLEDRLGFRVAGGDTVRKDRESFFTFTVLGRVEGKPLLRANARPGQRIYVSGRLGRSAAGLALLASGRKAEAGGVRVGEACLSAHLRPEPPLTLGPAIAACANPAAAIDISDGLSSELWHLSRQSGCRLTVEWGKLPYDADLGLLPGGEGWKDWVLHGGEEYQLLFTGDFSEPELARLSREAEVREIGRVTAGEGVGILEENGTERELQAAGWSH